MEEVPRVKLKEERLNTQVVRMISEDVARKYKVIPIRLEGNDLYLAMVKPSDLPVIDEIKLLTGCAIKPMEVTEKDIMQAISQYYKVEEISKQALIDMRLQKLKEAEVKKEEVIPIEEEIRKVSEIPVARLVNDIINGGINAKASDIHLEPKDPEMRVRYRVDGILHDVMTIPKHIEPMVISRVKILSNMDITERRKPQDGHIGLRREGKEYDFRVSTVLTIGGEKVVMRIFDKSTMLISLEQLGLTKYDGDNFRSLIAKPYGMILVTGPTGCGKTTTLYAVLRQLDLMVSNIITIENPVEYKLDGINQIQVDPGAKMTFATGLRTIVRQDPDVIMVGEIRDKETAEIAIQAALTGHLVFSTLHANDAPGAVTRLVDMGVEPFLISSTVIGCMAQRLCRTICPECKSEYEASEGELSELKLEEAKSKIKLVKGKGCDFCYNTGFRGRTGLFELMVVTEGIRNLILERRPAAEIKRLAIEEGMKTLQQNGFGKVLDRISTVDEVRRVVYTEE